MTFNPYKKTLAAMAVGMVFSSIAMAATTGTTTQDDEVKKLDDVVVLCKAVSPGEIVLTETSIDLTPTSTGTLTDLLRSESFVQFDRNSRSAERGAEIAAPQISIRGSRPYENTYSLNGLGNNNTLQPGSWTGIHAPNLVPTGDSQSLMVSARLLDEVKVFSENISAQYGSFTGGVVDATIKSGRTDRWHAHAWSRFTQSDWAHLHRVNDTVEQDEFKRYRAGFMVDGPLMDGKLSALVAFEREHSTAPTQITLFDRHTEKRNNDNLTLRVDTDKDAPFYVGATLLYAPYEGTFYGLDTKDGQYKEKGGGLDLMINSQARLSFGRWKNDLGISHNEVSRQTNRNTLYQWTNEDWDTGQKSDYANWALYGDTIEGGYGDHTQKQNTLEWRSALTLEPLTLGNTEHTFAVGGELKWQRVKADQQGYTAYGAGVFEPGVHGSLADGIVDGEQYLSMMDVLEPYHRTKSVLSGALFAEDTFHIERVTLRPGLRVSWDNASDNVDIAPRFFADVDLLNNDRWHINGGVNRYYGTQILANELFPDMPVKQYSREFANGQMGDWVDGIPSAPWMQVKSQMREPGDPDTPYTDEYTVGASARITTDSAGDWYARIQGVERRYRDQLRFEASDKPGYLYKMGNTGRSKYRGLTLSLEKSFDAGRYGMHRAIFSVTRADLKGNANNWLQSWSEPVGGKKGPFTFNSQEVIVDGVRMPKANMPAGNFSPDWVVTYTHESSFLEDRLRMMALLRYESATDRLVADGFERGPSLVTYKYKTATQRALVNMDLSMDWDIYRKGDTTVTLDLDVLNVFNRRNEVIQTIMRVDQEHCQMGRQFFVGVSAKF